MYLYLFIYFVAVLHGMWDLSRLTRDPSGIQSVPPAVEAQSLNHWATREVLCTFSRSVVSDSWRPCGL